MAFVYWIHLPSHSDITKEGYIGFTSKSVEERFKKHLRDSFSNQKRNYTIQNAIRKYGIDGVVVSTLIDGSEEYCLLMESKLRPSDNIGWNQSSGGIKPCGRRYPPTSEETKSTIEKAKITLSKLSEEEKLRRKKVMSESRKNSDNYKEALQKMWDSRRGKPLSEDHKKALSQALKGKKNSDEARRKIRLSKLGIPRSQECKDKVSKTKRDKNLKPWDNWLSNHSIWEQAEYIYIKYLENERCSHKRVEKILGFGAASLRTMFKYFNKGWIPTSDKDYQNWKQQTKGAKC